MYELYSRFLTNKKTCVKFAFSLSYVKFAAPLEMGQPLFFWDVSKMWLIFFQDENDEVNFENDEDNEDEDEDEDEDEEDEEDEENEEDEEDAASEYYDAYNQMLDFIDDDNGEAGEEDDLLTHIENLWQNHGGNTNNHIVLGHQLNIGNQPNRGYQISVLGKLFSLRN